MNNIIFGVTGQDGSYLSEILINKGEKVLGVKRRSSTHNTWRLEEAGVLGKENFTLIEGDVTDYASVSSIINSICGPSHIYNTAAQSHVATSFEQPLYTFNVNTVGVNNILEVIRKSVYRNFIKFLQCSTSEMFGDTLEKEGYQCEETKFNPKSPYAISKVAAHQLVNLYRDAYGIKGYCPITFNHGSPRRGEKFVEKKIVKYVVELYAALKLYKREGVQKTFPKLKLGNIYPCRDWTHAYDVCNAFYSIIHSDKPDDYIVASGKTHSISELLQIAFLYIGENWNDWVEIDQSLCRQSEVPFLLGNTQKIRNKLGWEPTYSFKELIHEMINKEMEKELNYKIER